MTLKQYTLLIGGERVATPHHAEVRNPSTGDVVGLMPLASEADLDRWSEVGKNPDGTTNKFNRALKDFARIGYLGLQDHGSPVWYRNIRIKSLDPAL